MAVATYNSDLTDITTAESTTNWSELSGYTSGSAPTQEGDYYIQGSYCVSQQCGNKSGQNCGLEYDYGSDMSGSFATGDVFLFWQVLLAGNAVDTFANAGLRLGVGSSSGNMNFWISGGGDFGRNPYGGWSNVAIDPTFTPVDSTNGTPTAGNYRIFGSSPNLLNTISKGYMHAMDAIRYGRGDLYIEYGQAAAYGTFTGMASANDGSTARWGLFQEQFGGYLWKGLMSLGTSTNAVDFRDSNKVIQVDDTPRAYAAFNSIEINHASSRVDWTTISIIALGTYSKGKLEVIDNADINFDGCSFTGLNTFIFQSNSSVLNTIFQDCGLITAAGADMDGSSILESSVSADASALNWNVATDPDGYLDDMTFSIGDNAHHAIEFGTTSPLTMTIRGMVSSGFHASNAQNDSTFYIARTSGTVTINVVGGTGNFSYKTAGATVVIVVDPVTIKVHTVESSLGLDIENARVFLKASDGTGPFPFEESVTISNSGTTATVTHNGHAMATDDYVDIKGASHWQNNGAHKITKVNDNSYTYVMTSAPGSSPTGTIISTFVALTGLTNSSGLITASRVYPSDQPIEGWTRLTPQYKTGSLFGDISSTLGLNLTGVLVNDE